MVTKRKSELSKATGDVRRAFGRFGRALPMVARVNWRMVLMPWRMIPMPIALALIALVALAMVLDTGDAPASANGDVVIGDIMIGGDVVAPGTRCEEDETIYYLALLGGEGVGCVHVEYIVMEFLLDCVIGNSEHGDNLASFHLRDQAFGSWCVSVVDDASDGTVSLADLLFDTASTVAPAATSTVSPAITDTPNADHLPAALPKAGSR